MARYSIVGLALFTIIVSLDGIARVLAELKANVAHFVCCFTEVSPLGRTDRDLLRSRTSGVIRQQR